MFMQAYKAAFGTIIRKPFMLWGLSLLSGIICFLATAACGMLGFLGTAFGYVITVGMSKVYLDGLEGKEVNSDQLFSGFNKRVFRIAGGMAWKDLWIIIQSLAVAGIPLAIFLVFAIIGMIPGIGFVFGILGAIAAFIALIPASIYFCSKTYAYSFVPYILATKPDVTATQALRLSMELTNGKKLQMWLADFLFGVIVFFITLILGLLAAIPFIGFIFGIVLFAWTLILVFFAPLFKGLYTAEFYRLKPVPKAPKAPKAPKGVPYGYAPQGYAPQQGYQNYAPQQGYAHPGYQQAPQGYQQVPQGYQQAPQAPQAPQGYQQVPQQQAPQQAPQGYNPMNNQ